MLCRNVLLLLLASSVALASAAKMPSCEEDTAANCSGEGADMSPQGIEKCLQGLASRSPSCKQYLKIVKECTEDLTNGPCSRARDDGEEMLCLIERTKPSDLSAKCKKALPKKMEMKGLKKFWAQKGKRELTREEEAELTAEEMDIYNGWMARKKGKKTDKSRDRDYAVKAAKKQRAIQHITDSVASRLKELSTKPTEADALKFVEEEMSKAIAEDLTKTLEPFRPQEKKRIAKQALRAKRRKSEL